VYVRLHLAGDAQLVGVESDALQVGQQVALGGGLRAVVRYAAAQGVQPLPASLMAWAASITSLTESKFKELKGLRTALFFATYFPHSVKCPASFCRRQSTEIKQLDRGPLLLDFFLYSFWKKLQHCYFEEKTNATYFFITHLRIKKLMGKMDSAAKVCILTHKKQFILQNIL